MYPNGSADVNYFHACGGMPLLIKTLLNEGLLHRDVNTILGHGLKNSLKNHISKMVVLTWRDCPSESADQSVLCSIDNAFDKSGGLKSLKGILVFQLLRHQLLN